jgi:hypothetical protein
MIVMLSSRLPPSTSLTRLAVRRIGIRIGSRQPVLIHQIDEEIGHREAPAWPPGPLIGLDQPRLRQPALATRPCLRPASTWRPGSWPRHGPHRFG